MKKSRLFNSYSNSVEPTVQQEDCPQVPPLKPPPESEDVRSLKDEAEYEKADNTFFTLFEAHFGQDVSFSETWIL